MRKLLISCNICLSISPEDGITAPYTAGEVPYEGDYRYCTTLDMSEEEFAEWTEVQRRFDEFQEKFKQAVKLAYDEKGHWREKPLTP